MKTSDIKIIDKRKIKNIIFDWGGVITNINYQATIDAFSKLGFDRFGDYFTHNLQNDIFKKFEIGEISPITVRNELHRLLPSGISDIQIDLAWCSMLRDTPIGRLELLKRLGKKYRLILLSNTNIIHANYYIDLLQKEQSIDYVSIFDKVYFSHEIKMRKPNRNIFEYVLNDSQIVPEETLFIDDTEINIDVASTFGIQSLYLQSGLEIENLFRDWIILENNEFSK